MLDGAYWLDATDEGRAACVHCVLPHRRPAPDAPGAPARDEASGRDGDEPGDGGDGDDAQDREDGEEGLLGRVQAVLTSGNASRLRAAMLTCSLGTVIVGAAATLRR
ncbi:hypothetical protein BGK67_03820 [Streptomyces subrutilus]|uniref:Uncharacterized protein n=1 Tax=Streptomyces subrutilus TaxID=36818 RepID=A0A1E5PM41_9ACTN|nr:hypothetical protein BGK67_03820 [Streptomyces subrutilus]